MVRRGILEDSDSTTRIDLAPMIDCVFLLLIFFLVTTVFVEEPGVDVLKPDASIDEPLEKNSILVAISADNRVIYGGKEVGISGAGARVKQLLNKQELPVIIQADARAEHGTFSALWSEMKNAGAKKISLSTRDDQESP